MLVCSQWVWWWVSVGEGLWGAVAVYILCQYLRGWGNRSVTWGHTFTAHWPVCLSGCMVARLRIDRPTNLQERTSRSSWCETIIGLSLSVCMSVCLHVCLSVCTITANVSNVNYLDWMPACLAGGLATGQSGCHSDWIPACLSGGLSTCQSGCPHTWSK